MKLVANSGTLGLIALAAFASPYALAEEATDASDSWYVGGNYGQSRATIDDPRIISSLLGAGFTTTSIVDDNRDNGYKLFAGYQFSRNFALEAGYFNLGQFGFVATTVPAGTFTGNIKLQGANLDLVGILPLTDRFSAFGRVGVTYVRAKDHFTGTGLVHVLDPNPSKSGGNYKFGAGLQYAFNHAVAVRAEAERYRVDDAVGNKGDIDLYSLGLVFRFGGDNDEHVVEPVREVAPAPMAADCSALDDDRDGVNNCNDKCPSTQAGQAVGPDGCPVPLTIDLKGVNFDFDKATLRPDAVAILDEAVSVLEKYPQLRVEVAGHTDSIGSEQYNQGLSERRARAVYDYLAAHGIDRARMAGPTGYGESRPIAPNTNPDGSDNPEGRAMNRRTELNVQN